MSFLIVEGIGIANVSFTLQNQLRMLMLGHTVLRRDFSELSCGQINSQAAELIYQWKIVHTAITVGKQAQFQREQDMWLIIIFSYSMYFRNNAQYSETVNNTV